MSPTLAPLATTDDPRDKLSTLLETAHLLESPRNAAHLLRALPRALRRSVRPRSVASLRRELKLAEED